MEAPPRSTREIPYEREKLLLVALVSPLAAAVSV
jgi:hypothetical protein